MQLIYRGTTFNYDPTKMAARSPVQRTSESPYKLIYRGITYRIDPTVITETSVKPAVYKLIYRGTTYQSNHNKRVKVTSIDSSVNCPKHRTLQDAK